MTHIKTRSHLALLGLFFLVACADATRLSPPLSTTSTPSTTLTPITLPVIPTSDPDFLGPLRSVHYWLGTSGTSSMDVPISGAWTSPLDHYARFQWRQIESDTGTFDFTRFDNEFKSAINAGRKFSFGIMTLCPPSNCGTLPLAVQGRASDGSYLLGPVLIQN